MTGQALKERAMDAMEVTGEEFLAKMRTHAESIDMILGYVNTDDLRDYADYLEIKPPTPNYWGCIFRSGWRCIGRTKSRRASNHGREVRVWTREER